MWSNRQRKNKKVTECFSQRAYHEPHIAAYPREKIKQTGFLKDEQESVIAKNDVIVRKI